MIAVVSKFAPHAGGTATVWTEWCKRCPRERLLIIAPYEQGCQEFDQAQKFQIIRIRYPDIPKIRMPLLWLFLGLRACWEALWRRPVLIHFQQVFENASWGPLIKFLFKVPYIVHVYGEELVLARRHGWLDSWVRRVLAGARSVTTISHYSIELLRQMGYTRKVELIYPGVDTDRFAPGPSQGLLSRLGVPAGPTLLTVGRLMERKGHDMVLRALARLVVGRPDLSYVVAGLGPEGARLRRLTEELGLLERVFFLGKVSDRDLPQLMRECTAFVHPNRLTSTGDVEGFGIVFLEASACAVPVIGGATGGAVDAISQGKSGYLVNPEDLEELVGVLQRLLDNPQHCRQLGAQGRAFALGFSWAEAARTVWERLSIVW